MTKLVRVLAALAIAFGILLTGGTSASAAPPADINGDRISWFSRISCWDGGRVDIASATQYTTASYGSYRLRLALHRSSDDGRMALGPYRDVTANAGTPLRYIDWNASFSYAGDAYLIAYAYKWNGSYYAMVAREWVPCW